MDRGEIDAIFVMEVELMIIIDVDEMRYTVVLDAIFVMEDELMIMIDVNE